MSTQSWQPNGVRLRDAVRPRRPSARWAGLLICCALAALVVGSALEEGAAPVSAASPGVDGSLGARPLTFVPNAGQVDRRVRFSAHSGGASFYFTQKEAVLAFAKGDDGLALRLGFVGANPSPHIEGRQARTGSVNYLLGNDPAKWRTGIPTFGEVVYRDLWPGVDMVFRGANGRLKYEFVAGPGADVSDIRLAYAGAEGLAVGAAGELLIGTPLGAFRDEKPRTFQVINGRRVPVTSRYALDAKPGGYGFALGAYDPRYPLVIDPGLLYSTYLGGSENEEGQDVALGAEGSTYVTGFTNSTDFPASTAAFDETPNGPSDVFVTKFDVSGALVYSTYLGGAGSDGASGVAVDADGRASVAGQTDSSDFPTTPSAFDTH